MEQALRFQIDPTPGESARACSAIARCVLPNSGAAPLLLLFGMYGVVGAASYYLTPETRALTFVIGIASIIGTAYGLQTIGKFRLRRLRVADTHAAETYHVELSADGVRSWCAHIDAKYPWADFSKVSEDNEFYLLARPNGAGAAIPKRLLDDAANEQLREHLRGWSPDKGANLARVLTAAS